ERRLMTQHPRRRILGLAAGAAASPAVSRVPFAAGGGTDIIARIVAERMRESLGQPAVIENVAGANGSIVVGRVARAASDGYALVVGTWGTHVSNGAMYPLQYDLQGDFEPVSLVAT